MHSAMLERFFGNKKEVEQKKPFAAFAKEQLPGLAVALGLFGAAPEVRAEMPEASEPSFEATELPPVPGAEALVETIDPEDRAALRTRAEACVDAYHRAQRVAEVGGAALRGDYVFVVKTVAPTFGDHNTHLRTGVAELRTCFAKDTRTHVDDHPRIVQVFSEGTETAREGEVQEGVALYPASAEQIEGALRGISEVRMHAGTVREVSLQEMLHADVSDFADVKKALGEADGMAMGFTLEQDTASQHLSVLYDGEVRMWKADQQGGGFAVAGMVGTEVTMNLEKDRGTTLGLAVELGNPQARLVGGPFLATSLGETPLGDVQVVLQGNFAPDGFTGGTAALRISRNLLPEQKNEQ